MVIRIKRTVHDMASRQVFKTLLAFHSPIKCAIIFMHTYGSVSDFKSYPLSEQELLDVIRKAKDLIYGT